MGKRLNPHRAGLPHLGSFLALTAALVSVLLCGCGRYRPVPAVWEPGTYRPVSVKDLLEPRKAGLASGEKVRVEAYFWEFLSYDPAMAHNYLTMLRHPVSWPRLEWFSVYGTAQMREYFDRLAMDRDQRRTSDLKRLDHVAIYGELASMGGDLLYLRVNRVQKLEEE